MLDIVAHASPKYPPRTFENAQSAHLTIALALDYTTAGERLTKRAAGDAYLALPLTEAPLTSARRLWSALNRLGASAPVLNVAGNGIYSLVQAGWTQDAVDRHLLELLAPVHRHLPLGKVISGGQTGVDLAGGVAAHALGIPVRMTLPAGLLQRDAQHREVRRDPADLRAEVVARAAALAPVLAVLRLPEPAE